MEGWPGVCVYADPEAESIIPFSKGEKLVSGLLKPQEEQRSAAGQERLQVPGRRPDRRPPRPLTWQLAPETPAGQVQL